MPKRFLKQSQRRNFNRRANAQQRYYNQQSKNSPFTSSSSSGTKLLNESMVLSGGLPSLSLFPDRMRRTMRMVTSIDLNGGFTTIAQTFKGNSMHTLGPQTDYAGAFGGNAAGPVQIFLGATAPAGSNSLYNKSRVYGSRCTVEYTPWIVGGLVTQMPLYLSLFPSSQPSFLGMPNQTIREQKYVVSMLTAVMPNRNYTLTQAMSTWKITGLKNDSEVRADGANEAVAGADPTDQWYWHITLLTANGTTNMSGFLTVTIDYDTEFFSQNQLTSVNV